MWLIPVGMGLLVLLAWLSYFTAKARELFPAWARFTLIALRSISFILIFFLFLGPRIISRVSSSLKPVFILAVDNSSSMADADSIPGQENSVTDQLTAVRAELDEDFEVKTYLFGGGLSESDQPDFGDKATDFGLLFEQLTLKHHADPVAGMMLFSDGIYNQGANPIYSSEQFPFPVHTVAYGDTSRHPDLRIEEVRANDLVYKNSKFPVEMLFGSFAMDIDSPGMRVYEDDVLVLDTIAPLYRDEMSGNIRFMLEAAEAGIHNYRVQLQAYPNEDNIENNSWYFTVEVVEQKAKILILYNSVHPDIAAISTAIRELEQYELEAGDLSKFSGRLSEYQLLILHQVPGSDSQAATRIFQELGQERIPVWFILGGQSDLRMLNQFSPGVEFDNLSGMMEDISPLINPGFSLFKLSGELEKSIGEWPPLKGPFSPVKTDSRSEILMYQTIKTVQLEYPLFCFNKTRNGKNAVLLGEGIWRWRLAEYLETGGNDELNYLISSIVQYLVIEDDKDQFRIEIPKTVTETRKLSIRAEVYNESYEELEDAIVNFSLTDSLAKVSEYEMRPAPSGYLLVLDPLKAGMYSYSAETTIGQKRFSKQGSIFVSDVRLEDINMTADFRMLERLADQKKGRYFSSDQTEDIRSFIRSLEPGEEAYNTESKWISLIQLKYLLFVIVLLLTLEWLLRRWFGTR